MNHSLVHEFLSQLPELVLVATAILVVFLDAFLPERDGKAFPV